jgi:hypothetical protein
MNSYSGRHQLYIFFAKKITRIDTLKLMLDSAGVDYSAMTRCESMSLDVLDDTMECRIVQTAYNLNLISKNQYFSPQKVVLHGEAMILTMITHGIVAFDGNYGFSHLGELTHGIFWGYNRAINRGSLYVLIKKSIEYAEAQNITPRCVTYHVCVPPDTTAPTLTSVSGKGAIVTLKYDEKLKSSSVPAPTDFSISGGYTVTDVTISGEVMLRITPALLSHEIPSVSYTPSISPLQDIAGNLAVGFSDQMIVNVNQAFCRTVTDISASECEALMDIHERNPVPPNQYGPSTKWETTTACTWAGITCE